MRTRDLSFVVLSLFATSCISEAQFTTQFTADYPKRAERRVSIFGVYRDGRMSADIWEDVGPELSAAFGSGKCDAVYNQELTKKEKLASAVDDYTRANGPTDDLIEQFAAAAEGDSILVFAFSGHPPAPNPPTPPQTGSLPSAPQSGGHGRGMAPGGSPGPMRKVDSNRFEVSATLFSVPLHHSVAAIAMIYEGQSVHDALKQFGDKLGNELSHAKCVGWKSDVHIDDERIRRLAEE